MYKFEYFQCIAILSFVVYINIWNSSDRENYMPIKTRIY